MSDQAQGSGLFIGRITSLIGIVSSAVTILLTVFNVYTKTGIDAAEVRLKEREQAINEKLREREAALEESKDRVSRYVFVKSLIPDVIGKDNADRSLTINLVRLTLNPDEAERFFNGLKFSPSKALQSLGSEGVSEIHEEKSRVAVASTSEQVGFQHLAGGNVDEAIKAFDAADRAYPTYHNVHEISALLKQQQPNMAEPDARKKIVGRILEQYSWGMPADTKEKLQKAAGKG